MVSSVPTMTTSEVLKETTDILKESIKASNRLSQVMDYQAESLSLSLEQSSNKVSSNGTTPHVPVTASTILSQASTSTFNIQGTNKGKVPSHGHGPSSSPTTTTAIVPGMSEFEKVIAANNLKEKAESDDFIRNFAAKQRGEKLLSVTDSWFVNLLAEFRAQQAVKMAADKEAASKEMEELLRMGSGGKKGKKVKRGKGFKGWLVSIF
jgi:hypothetical protein